MGQAMLTRSEMTVWERITRHARITKANYVREGHSSPPFLILFINSICNQACEHCFYWRNLNRRDDLTVDEMAKLSGELGTIENLNLSGGEPFLRKDFGEICRMFIRNNGVKQIYVPTNGSFADKTVRSLEAAMGLQIRRRDGLGKQGDGGSGHGPIPTHFRIRTASTWSSAPIVLRPRRVLLCRTRLPPPGRRRRGRGQRRG